MRKNSLSHVSTLTLLVRFISEHNKRFEKYLILFVVPLLFALRIRNSYIDKTACDSAKQTARLTFTTVTKAFMVLIIKSSQDQTGKPQWMWP